MAEITAALVKDLRDKTGAGMMDCKKALAETQGDLEAAIDWLRKKGLAAAAKKSSRTAAEGLVGVSVAGKAGALVEVNSETDFVAKNDIFQNFVREVTAIALAKNADTAAILSAPFPGSERTVQDELTHNIATIGENQSFRRAHVLTVSQGVVAGYTHNAVAAGLGKIGVLVGLESSLADTAPLEAFAKQLAMHIAASNPLALDETGLDADLVERERAIAADKAAQTGKGADIVAKMVEGAIAKFKAEQTLLGQVFVMDGKAKVAEVVARTAKELGAHIQITAFVRYQLGEGIEKEKTDFAAEVAAAMGN
jgi:elongation factor Ts